MLYSVVQGAIFLSMVLCSVLLIRNGWVYCIRTAWIDDDATFNEWHRAPNYQEMLLHFWDWSTDFEHWATPKPTYLNKVRPDKAGQLQRLMKGLKKDE